MAPQSWPAMRPAAGAAHANGLPDLKAIDALGTDAASHSTARQAPAATHDSDLVPLRRLQTGLFDVSSRKQVRRNVATPSVWGSFATWRALWHQATHPQAAGRAADGGQAPPAPGEDVSRGVVRLCPEGAAQSRQPAAAPRARHPSHTLCLRRLTQPCLARAGHRRGAGGASAAQPRAHRGRAGVAPGARAAHRARHGRALLPAELGGVRADAAALQSSHLAHQFNRRAPGRLPCPARPRTPAAGALPRAPAAGAGNEAVLAARHVCRPVLCVCGPGRRVRHRSRRGGRLFCPAGRGLRAGGDAVRACPLVHACCARAAPRGRRHPGPQCRAYFNGVHVSGLLSLKTAVVKLVSAVFVLAAGLVAEGAALVLLARRRCAALRPPGARLRDQRLACVLHNCLRGQRLAWRSAAGARNLLDPRRLPLSTRLSFRLR